MNTETTNGFNVSIGWGCCCLLIVIGVVVWLVIRSRKS
jgi:hypothetical protein